MDGLWGKIPLKWMMLGGTLFPETSISISCMDTLNSMHKYTHIGCTLVVPPILVKTPGTQRPAVWWVLQLSPGRSDGSVPKFWPSKKVFKHEVSKLRQKSLGTPGWPKPASTTVDSSLPSLYCSSEC